MSKHESLTAALAAFQAELPKVHKGSINPHFKSKFASLEDMTAVVLPLLGEHGLAWATLPTVEDGQFVLKYRLLHESGTEIGGIYPLGGSNAQQRGSEITYARRYALSAVTGIAADEDDDGNAASQPKKQAKPEPVRMSEQAWKGWQDRLAAAETQDAARAVWAEAQKLGALKHLAPDGQELGAVIQARAAVLK